MKILIAAKVAILIGIEIVLIAGSFGYLAAHEAQNQLIGNSINIAGKNRFLAASVLLQTEYYLSGSGTSLAVEESLRDLEANLLLLRDGGEAGRIELGALPPGFAEEWGIIYGQYSAFEDETQAVIATNPSEAAVASTTELRQLGDMLIASSDTLVADLGIYSNDSARQLIAMQVLLAFLNIGVHTLMLYLILRILKPIKSLTKAAVAVREGDLSASVPITGSDELSELSESFNSMLDSLKESATSLAKEKVRYQDLYDNAPDLYCSTDLDGLLLDCNSSYFKSLGYTKKEELIGKSVFESIAESSLDAMHESFEQWKRTGNIVNKEVWLKRKDGTTFPTLISASAIHDADGAIVASDVAVIDVTEISETKRQLEKANARLKELDRMKNEFLSVASHELRTPIQPIMGVAALAARGAMSNERAWEIVIREAKRLQNLTNDLLDVTRIEGQHIQLRRERFCINDVIRDILHEGKIAHRENVQVKLELAADEDLNLDADKSRITQVINNLLGNAIKFTKTGSITIVTKPIYDRRFIEIFVSDTGAGIPKEILPRLFSKFATKSVEAGTEHGTGLGLYICKEIVVAHGGSITGFNRDEGGATFRILLPASRWTSMAQDRTTDAQ